MLSFDLEIISFNYNLELGKTEFRDYVLFSGRKMTRILMSAFPGPLPPLDHGVFIFELPRGNHRSRWI
jgi:hypothetical protein